MNLLRDVPVRQKLTLISVLTSGIVLLLACGAFLTYEQITFRDAMVRDLSVTARMIGLNSAAALAFDDQASADATLRALDAHPLVVAARIYRPDGSTFASYRRNAHPDAGWPEQRVDSERFEAGQVELFRRIDFVGEPIGTIYVEADSQVMQDRLVRYAAIAATVLLVSTLLAFLIATRLQRVISKPILRLADTAARVAEHEDYTLRAVKQGDDELGQLIDNFNVMLTRIQERDERLRHARAELEQRVDERTTDLKAARAEAERERARFKFIFESVPVGISWRVPYVDDIHLINPAHERISGVSGEMSLIPDIFMKVTHPEDRAHQIALNARCASGELNEYTVEKRYIHPDGRIVWATLTMRIYTDPTTGEKQAVTTLVDISDLKRAQEEAEREKLRFQFIFESVPVGISWVIPGDFTTYLSNPAHATITGVAPEESTTPGIFRLISDPDEYSRQVALEEKLEAGQIDQYSIEKRYRHRDGRWVWALFTKRLFVDPRTQTRQAVTTLVDITERKRSTDELDRIFTLSQDMICTVSFDGYFKRINPAFERTLGYPPDELLAHPYSHYVSAAANETSIEGNLLSDSQPTASFETRYLCKDGSSRWLQWSAIAVKEEALFYCVVRDVTKQKEDAVELEQMHRRLLDTSRQAGMAEVATGVLHNVGNVLNSINISATVVADRVRGAKSENVGRIGSMLRAHESDIGSFLSKDPKGKQIPGYLQILADQMAAEKAEILDELEQLGKNLDHIKDIVAMQQNYAKLSGHAETFSIVDLVEDALRMNAGALVRHDVSVIRDYRARPTVTVEKHKVLQILVNLIRNAKYACDEAAIEEKRITARITETSGRVRIEIEDNGTGIPPENFARIFNHGFTTRKEGHGFGLHSGALAAKEIHGSLEAFSEGDGKGALFALNFPKEPEEGLS